MMGFINFLLGKNKKQPKIEIQNKESRTIILNTKYGTAHWPEKDYENFSKETYMKNVISFRCIFYLATSLASVDWGLFRESDTERIEITDNPINKLLKRANPDTSFVVLIQKLISHLVITGNTYIEKVAPASGIPQELYVLRPDKMTIKTDKDTGRKIAYDYDNGSLIFDIDPITGKSDILHIKLFHPLDDFFGLSITEPTAREIDSSNEATEWQKKVMENEGRPGMAVLINGFLADEQWDRLEQQLNDKYGGKDNAGKTIIIEGESKGDVKPYAWSPKEMDWIESNRELSRKICNGYGIPPMLLGIPGDNTYSNQKEARAAFWEETVMYYLNLIKGEFNNWLFETEEIFIDYDINNVPAMAYKQEIIWQRIKEASFMTINEKREAVGMEKIEGGDVILVTMGVTTLDQLLLANEMTNEMPDEETQEEEEEKEVQKLIEQGYDEDIARSMVGATYYD
jgi:HK97 family phage portal protein